jgi:S-DNA-T family DNA segregation ATPase FtsK/SpoIIIE
VGKNRKIKTTSESGAFWSAGGNRGREVGGVIALGASLFLALSVLSLQIGAQWMGPFGRGVGSAFYGIAGACGYLVIGLVVWAALRALLERRPPMPLAIGCGVGLGVIALSVLVHLVAGDYRVAGHGPGGAIGEHLAEVSRAVISTAGTALLASMGIVVAIVIATPLRMRQVLGWIWHGMRTAASGVARGAVATARFCADVARAILPERDHDDYDAPTDDDDDDVLELGVGDRKPAEPPIIERVSKATDTTVKTEVVPPPGAKPAKKKRLARGTEAEAADTVETPVVAPTPAPPAEPRPATGEPVIVEPRFRHADQATMAAKEKQAEAERRSFIKLGDGDYQLPSIQLLNYDAGANDAIDRSAMLELSARLTQTLENYGVKGDVIAIRPGPVVTMYEFAPAPGTRVNKIVNLTDDLALALEALRVRIVAPIPGKAAVGIEVPNKQREKVFLKEILADDAFRRSKHRLPLALGKDIEGAPAVVDLWKMPHLLVAGTTGSGKSVAVNAMITSLLYNCTPEDVRLIMVDPKMLELSIYEGVPHLLLPVVTDPRKANLALRWAVDEMERRYDLLARAGVRDIATYNDKLAKQKPQVELPLAADGTAPEPPPQRLPYIVVVIDEFADLMMCAPKEVETSVARIAQKARAAGIHLILATQRPSVDVITGLIKANFPSRVAFHVASKIDSRTILDQTGAEALLGAGDMLFSDRGTAPARLHGCYVDEVEIHRVVEFLKTQGRPVYNLEILKPRDEDGEGGSDGGMPGGGGKSDDDMYDKAVYVVTSTRNASISWVQRQLRIGYNRAARLVEEMEKQGVVSPPDHTNKREVLVGAM